MGFEQDYFARQRGRREAAEAASFRESPGYFGGFIESTLSGFGELFGAEASPAAAEFRAENPLAGFASQMIGPLGAYGGAYRLSRTAAGAAALDSAMATVPGVRALTAVDNPVLYGAAREVLRYSPLELGRLGIGFANAENSGDYGEMLADVGLSTILTGGFGAIGGFFRGAGQVAARGGRVVGADLAFRPTFEYRMSRVPGAQVTGDLPLQDVQNNLLREVFTERPFDAPVRGIRNRYVDELAGGTPESDALVNTLFRPSGRRSQGLVREPLMDRAGQWTLDDVGQQELLGALGMQDMGEIAESLVFPRVLTVNSERAAGTMARILDDSPVLQYVGDGTMMARESRDGLWVIARRVRAGAAPEGGARRQFGNMGIGDGDRWLIGKTDQPQRFVPAAHRVAELNVNSWARYREGFKQLDRSDVFNQSTDQMLQALTPADFRDLAVTTRRTWVARTSERLAQRFGEVSGLKNSQRFRDMADSMYATLKPTMFLENQNPIYQRLFGLLRNNMRTADETLNRIMGGAIRVKGSPALKRNVEHMEGFNGRRALETIWRDLDDAERQLVVRAAQSQTPADDLAKLTADGLVSSRASTAVAELQAINKDVWEQVLMPAFRSAGLDESRFNLLEGYILPRVFKGDWFVPVVDDAGRQVWLASGGLGAAKKEADAIVEEAASRGLRWRREKETASHVSQTDVEQIEKIDDLVRMQLSRSAETQEVVQGAMKRLELARAANRRGGSVPAARAPASLRYQRSGVAGSPDVANYTLEDVMKASEDHYRQLLRFAGYHTWRERWLPEAMNLSKQDATLFNDLRRKANQMMGIEGTLTNALNNTLSPLFGNHLGGKAATRIAQGTNELMYNWNLAIGNPTFALLNLMNPLQTVAPWIAYVTKVPTEAAEKLMQVSLRYGSDGRVNGTMSFWHPMKVLGQSLREIRQPGDELLEAFGRAKTDGTLSPQLYEGWVGGTSRAHQTLRDAYHNNGGGINGGWEFIKRTSTFLAEKSEEFSRINAFTAAWILGRDHFGLAGDALYRFAQRGTHVTMYGYNVVDRSRMFTGPIGSMFGLFKNWQFHFIGQMAQYADVAVNQGIWQPLLWQGASALALGGLGATPLKLLADGLAKWQGDAPSSFLWLQENWPNAADEIYFGLPALLGGTLQASAQVPGTDVRNDLTNMSNFVFIERAKAAAKALGGAADLWSEGDVNPLTDGNTRDRLLQALAPRAVFRLFSATEGDYVRSMTTGYPQVRGVSSTSRFLHALGLNQVEVERQQVAGRELWNRQEEQRSLIRNMGQVFADAMMANDREEMQRIADRAVMMGVPMSSVLQSAHTRMRRETQDTSLSRFDAAEAQRYLSAIGRLVCGTYCKTKCPTN